MLILSMLAVSGSAFAEPRAESDGAQCFVKTLLSGQWEEATQVLADLAAIVDGEIPTPSQMPLDLGVMTFNIRYGSADDGKNRWELRRPLVEDLLRAHHADIIGVQEAQHDQVLALDAALARHGWIGQGRLGASKGEYTPIFYDRTRLEVLAEGTFWLSETPEVPASTSYGNRLARISTWGHFRDKSTHREFLVYNFHLDHQSQNARVGSVEQILAHIDARDDRLPVILTGDFNADMKNEALAPLLDANSSGASRFKSAFAVVAPQAEGVGTFHLFEGVRNRAKIDFVFVDKHFDVLGAAILRDQFDGRYPSDHFPVSARLRLR